MSRPVDEIDPQFRVGLTVLLSAIAVFGAVDLVLDQPTSLLTLHVAVEVGFVTLCLGAVSFLWRGWVTDRLGRQRSEQSLQAREAERDLWYARAHKLLGGLGAEIQAQFDRWSLSPSEQEIALLLLKGLGHKEAASLTGRSERTVRQHAAAVYRKAGLAGRAELSAFFLEDLLLPSDAE